MEGGAGTGEESVGMVEGEARADGEVVVGGEGEGVEEGEGEEVRDFRSGEDTARVGREGRKVM